MLDLVDADTDKQIFRSVHAKVFKSTTNTQWI